MAGVPLTYMEGEREAADAWLRGDVTTETEPTGALVGGLIHALGLSQIQAAAAWRCTVSTVQRWRKGLAPPPSGLAWWGLVRWAEVRLSAPASQGEGVE